MRIATNLTENSAYYSLNAAPNTTARYNVLPTAELVEHAERAGFHFHSYQQKVPRKAEKYGYAKHIVRLRKNGQQLVGDVFPEIVIINSHDKTTSLQFMLGFFRMVCANGLIAGDVFDSLGRILHNHKNPMEKVIENIEFMCEESTRKIPLIQQMRETVLIGDNLTSFVERSAQLLPTRVYENPMELNFANRYDDTGDSLWLTLNRVQENLLKGNAQIINARGRSRKARSIGSIDTNIDVNRKLWSLAESYLPMAA